MKRKYELRLQYHTRTRHKKMEHFSDFSIEIIHKLLILKLDIISLITMIKKLKKIATLSMILLSSLILFSANVFAATEIIQPSSKDAYIVEGGGGSYTGTSSYILVYPRIGYRFRTLVNFDLTSIPSGSTVSSALLKLYYNPGVGDPSGRTYMAYRITQLWIETSVSWDNLATPDGGIDYTTTGGASSTVPSSSGWMTWTVTDIVKAWIEGGESNHGFLIKDNNEESSEEVMDQSNFYSREWSEAGQRPILEITYSEQVMPTIESAIFDSPSSWVTTDTFNPGDNVCVIGDGFSPYTTYDVQVVNDVDWTDGMTIPSYVAKTAVTTDEFGEIMDAVPVWNGATPGKYDIVVDVNDSGEYEANIDALDDSDIEVTAGFFVVPEVAIGSIMTIAAMFVALGLYAYKRKQTPKQ